MKMTSDSSVPLVSICMTVYNARQFLPQTLESLFAQTYGNTQIVISDNASSDGSSEFCKQVADSNTRVLYHRNDSNLGAVGNWNKALSLSRGKYIMWASDHDLWHPDYIRWCVEILEDDEQCVLVYTQTQDLDFNGNPKEATISGLDLGGLRLVPRFKKLLWNLRRCDMVYGLQRAEVAKRVGGFPAAWAMDLPYLTALSLYGTIRQVDKPGFFRRENRCTIEDAEKREELWWKFALAQLEPDKAEKRCSGQTKSALYRESRNALLSLVWGSPVGLLSKLHLSLLTLVCYWSRYRVGFAGLERIRFFFPRWLRRNAMLRTTRDGQVQ